MTDPMKTTPPASLGRIKPQRRLPVMALLVAGCHLALSGGAQAQVTWAWKTIAGTPEQRGSSDSPGPQARFWEPSAIVTDGQGNAYIADRSNHAVRKISPQGVVTTVAGTNMPGFVNQPGAAARFSSPSGIALDSFGMLYIADRGNNCIRRIAPWGEVRTLAGQAQAGSDNGTGGDAKFNSPGGVATTSTGTVYVADTENHTIRRITPTGVVTTIAGLAGTPGTANGTASSARFNRPVGIALHPDNTLLVTEAGNHSIRRVTQAGIVTTFAGNVGTPGADGGTTATATFRSPSGITVTADGTIYLTDTGNQTVRRILPSGQIANMAGLPGMSGVVDGLGPAARFSSPSGVAVLPSGAVLVTDRENNLVRHMTPLGLVSVFAGQTGVGDLVNSTSSGAMFSFPIGIVADESGYLTVSDYDNHTLRRISPAGVVSTLAGSAGAAGSTDGSRLNARFNKPRGLALDPSGNLYIADTLNNTIRKLDTAGQVTTVAGQAGQTGFRDGVGASVIFDRPMNLDWLPNYNTLIIADMGNDILRELVPGTRQVTTFAGVLGLAGVGTGPKLQAHLSAPCGVAIAPSREIFVSNYTGHAITAYGGGNYDARVVGGKFLNPGASDGPADTSRFRGPTGMDTDGFVIIIVDILDNTIRSMNVASPNVVTTIGGRAGRFGSRDGIGQGARFQSPHGVVKAPNGDIFVADSGNDRIVHGKAYATPWAAWQAVYNITSGPSGDDDGDGLVNLLEFAFATHPRDGAGGAVEEAAAVVTKNGRPTIIRDETGHIGIYPVRLDSHQLTLRYTPEFSSDLTDWTPHTGAVFSRAAGDEVNLLSARFPATLPNGKVPRFFRVVVSQM